MTTLIALVVAAVTFGTVLMYGTLGEILTEKSGNLNLGVEGIMYMGGAFGLAGAFYYEKAAGAAVNGPLAVTIAILSAFAAGMAASAIYSFITVTLRVRPVCSWPCAGRSGTPMRLAPRSTQPHGPRPPPQARQQLTRRQQLIPSQQLTSRQQLIPR